MLVVHIHKIKLFLNILLVGITVYSCEKTVQEPNIDTIPPQATIIYPSDGERVSGEIIIQIRSFDNQATDYIEFYINLIW